MTAASAISPDLVSSLNAAASTTSEVKKKTIDQEQFLKLFVAQLQHQDPLSPMEPDQLTAQLAQFSSLEQLTGINQKLEDLNGSSKQTLDTTLLGLLGKTVRFDGSHLAIKDGKASTVQYEVPSAATKVTAVLKAADGSVARTVELGAQTGGAHAFDFDGRDDHGRLLADGSYRVEISAVTAAAPKGAPLALERSGTVDGVDLASDPPVVLVGGERVQIEQVREVRERASS